MTSSFRLCRIIVIKMRNLDWRQALSYVNKFLQLVWRFTPFIFLTGSSKLHKYLLCLGLAQIKYRPFMIITVYIYAKCKFWAKCVCSFCFRDTIFCQIKDSTKGYLNPPLINYYACNVYISILKRRYKYVVSYKILTYWHLSNKITTRCWEFIS